MQPSKVIKSEIEVVTGAIAGFVADTGAFSIRAATAAVDLAVSRLNAFLGY